MTVSGIRVLFIAQEELTFVPSSRSFLALTSKIREYFSCPVHISSSKNDRICCVFLN